MTDRSITPADVGHAMTQALLVGALLGLLVMYGVAWLPGPLSPYDAGWHAGQCAGRCEAQGYAGGSIEPSGCACLVSLEAP